MKDFQGEVFVLSEVTEIEVLAFLEYGRLKVSNA